MALISGWASFFFAVVAGAAVCRLGKSGWFGWTNAYVYIYIQYLYNIRYALQLHRHEVQAIHMVNYRPQDLFAAGTLVAIIQRAGDLAPGDQRQLVLIDVLFHGHDAADFNVRRYVLPLRKDTTRRILLEELHLQPYCASVRQRCLIKLNNWLIPLSNHVLFELHHGDYIRVDLPPHPQSEVPTQTIACCLRQGHSLREIPRIYAQAGTPFEWEPLPNAEGGNDAQSLLQTHARCLTAETVAHAQRPSSEVKQLSLVDLLPHPHTTQIDFSAVQWFWQEIQHSPLEYWTSWPDDFNIPEVTVTEFQRLTSPSSQTPRMIHLYVDGSQLQNQVGAGIACLVEHDEGTFLAGCMAKAVEEAQFAFQGEHAAMVWALLWAIRISDWCLMGFGTRDLHFAFNFDAMNTGYQTAGYWRTKEHSQWRTMLRSLAQVLQQRHRHSHLHWNHVKAHSQHPFNELVDALAKFAATHPERVDGSLPWLRWFHEPSAMTNLQWLWYLEYVVDSPETAPALQGTTVIHTNNQVPDVLNQETSDDQMHSVSLTWARVQFSMKLATANVLTLATGSKWHGTSYTKQQLLQKQFHDEGCVVVGLQETRHRRIVDSNNEHYHMVGHAASSDGLDGVQMWFSKLWPLYESGPVIQRQHIPIVSSAPAYLIVRLCMPHFRAIFVTGRAPHNGLAHELSESFWRTISEDVCPYERDHLLFFMGDTNGHLGEHVTDAVGSHDGSQENGPGREFHNWMLTHHLCAPSTMIDYHVGARSSTFSSPDGVHKTRIDYIAVPTLIQYDHLSTWVDENIDLCGVREDHAAVVGRIQFTKEISSQRERSYPPPRLDRQQLAQHLGQPQTLHHLADVLTDAPWSLDPHRSADWLAAQTNQALFKLIPRAMRWRRKRHIPDEIWTQVENKKAAFRQLRCMKQTWRRTMMQTIFQTWRKRQPLPDPQQHLMRSWSALFDKAFAQTLLNYQQLTRQVTTLIKNADVQFYQAIAHESGQAYTHEGLTALWKRIKAVLPKNRIKQFQARYDIGDDLQQHFADLEAGQSVDDQVAQQQCVARNNRDCEAHLMPQHIALQELPTLAEIEELCLKQRPHRAAGLDGLPPEVCRQAAVVIAPFIHNVLLKAFVSGVEPFRYKGGLLVPIWKHKQSRQLASAYRGILLADVFGKVLHAWTRKRLLSTLLQRKAPGQIGGLPSQQTVTAVQLLRLHGKIGRSRRLSTAAIFVDLKAAFHHMLREFIFSVREPTTREMLDRIFDPNEFDVQQLARDLHEACNQQPHDIPAALRGFLHDIHKDTWFKLDASAQMTTVTQRGTRPGSPLADIGFNLLMSKMMWQIGDKLNTMPAYTQGCQAMGVTIPPLSWVDDLAVPIAVAEPSQLLPLMREVVAMLHETFQAHGMTMNFESGKSEAVVMYRGCGAAPLRTALFDTEAQPKLVVSTPTHILSLCIVATYRHLGARFTMDTDIAYETKLRAAMARQAFEELKRPLFLNKAIPLKGRLQLYNSLVIARLMYGCAAWDDVPRTAMEQMDSLVTNHQRRMAGIGFWSDKNMTDAELRHHLEVAPFRVTWACHRLKYLQHVAQHGAPYHKEILLLEYALGKGWLWEVSSDLVWMSKLVDLPFAFDASAPHWTQIWEELPSCRRWKALVSRAERKQILQERIARDVTHYHQLIVQELTHSGLEVWQGTTNENNTASTFTCWQCDRSFHSQQALAAHLYRKHDVMSAERPYIQSTHCPGCLKDFHTTWRVQQHLKYRPNGCWDRIFEARLPGEPITISMPNHLRHIKRLPAVRRLHGPLRPTSSQRQRISLRHRIAELRIVGAPDYAWWHPESDPALVQTACQAFTTGFHRWCAQESPDEISFHNMLFDAIFALPVPELLGGRLFVHWIETGFYDVFPVDLDPDIIQIAETAHMSMLDDIPAWTHRLAMKRLVQLWTNLPPDDPDLSAPLPPQSSRPYSRIHAIHSKFEEMAAEELQRNTWRIWRAPSIARLAPKGPFYVLHLYSGRRRASDFHEQVEKVIAEFPSLYIRVISIDTAVDATLDIHDTKLWHFLIEIAQAGRVLGLLQGPPCETWTSARHHQQVDEHGAPLRGPRPLRHADSLWGLDHLTIPELAQVFTGNILLLKGMFLACLVALRGGATFLENPAVPFAEEMASIWRLALVKMLLRRPGALFRKTTIEQWRFGAPAGIKPTTLLFSNCDLPAALAACTIPGLSRPETLLIGKDSEGRFRTAAAKEYPAALNCSFACALRPLLATRVATDCGTPHDEPWGHELAVATSSTEYGSIMPDYQPRLP